MVFSLFSLLFHSHSSSPHSASLLFLISADIFSPVVFRHKPHRRRRSCCRVNLLSAGYKAQLINQSLFALRCARPPMERIISAELQLLVPVESHSKGRGLGKRSSKNLCRASWTWETPVVQRDPPVTNDIKKTSLFENFSTVKWFYTIIAHSQTRLGYFSL